MERRKRNIEAYRQAKDGRVPEDFSIGNKSPMAAASEAVKPAAPQKRPAEVLPPGAAAGGGPFPSPPLSGLLKTTGKENPYRKAAKFLMLIGKEEAGKVLRHFSEAEVEAITREIAGIRRIEGAEAERLLSEFGFLKEAHRYPVGGTDTARRILVNAFGEEKGRDILSRCLPPIQERLFGFLEDFEPNQIHHLLRGETSAVLAVILPYISAEKASRLLPLFEPSFRKELVLRVARKQRISRDVLLRMEEALREKARKQAVPQESVELDGKAVLAEILKYVDLSKEAEIIGRLEEESPAVAEEIKERLFTIEVIEHLDDRDLHKIFQGMEDREIALLLKGKTDRIRAKVLGSLSERRRGFVADEYRVLGPVPRREADEATKDFLSLLRRLEAEGSLVIRRESDRFVE